MDNPNYHPDSLDTAKKNGPVKKPPSSKSIPHSYCIRSTVAQCFATFVHSLSMLTMGLLLTTPTAVIGKVHKVNSALSLTKDEVSWYACLVPLFQSLGCFLSGLLQNYIGRRQGVLLMHILAATTWIVLYRANSVSAFLISSVLAGLSAGLNDAPSLAYVNEITTPKLRGTLLMYTVYNIIVGNMLVFLLAWLIDWRTQCLVCLAWFMLSVTLTAFIPESPNWLIKQGKKEEAVEALRWLRGWVPEQNVLLEFEELSESVESSNSASSKGIDDKSPPGICERMNHLFEGRTWRPFVLIIITWFFVSHGTLASVRSYTIIILNGLNLPVDSNLLACFFNLVSPFGGIWGGQLTKMVGRRVLALWVVLLTSVLSVLMGLYILFKHELSLPWVYIMMYSLLGFLGLHTCNIPVVLVGELYPPNTKSMAVPGTTVIMHLCSALYIKFYYILQRWMATQAIYISYGILGIVGLLYIWFFMPETEGKTKAEIGELFASGARSSCIHYREKK